MVGKKRLFLAAGALASIGAVVALATGVTFGFFSATTPTATSTFATGTVFIGTPTTTTCAVTNMVPGDDSVGYSPQLAGITDTPFASCSFEVTYTGSAPAYIGLGTTLTGTLANSLHWQIQQSATDAGQPGPFTTSGAINTNTAADPLYVATDPGTANGGGGTYTFWVDYALPSTVSSQTLTPASLGLTVYAVQQANNGTGVCTAGVQCSNITAWS